MVHIERCACVDQTISPRTTECTADGGVQRYVEGFHLFAAAAKGRVRPVSACRTLQVILLMRLPAPQPFQVSGTE